MLWFRRKGYFSTESNLNSFIFVDEKYYWNWSHYSVDVINIENIKFLNASVTMQIKLMIFIWNLIMV